MVRQLIYDLTELLLSNGLKVLLRECNFYLVPELQLLFPRNPQKCHSNEFLWIAILDCSLLFINCDPLLHVKIFVTKLVHHFFKVLLHLLSIVSKFIHRCLIKALWWKKIMNIQGLSMGFKTRCLLFKRQLTLHTRLRHVICFLSFGEICVGLDLASTPESAKLFQILATHGFWVFCHFEKSICQVFDFFLKCWVLSTDLLVYELF